ALLRDHRQLAPEPHGAALRGHHRAHQGRRAHHLHGALRCPDGPAQSRLFHRAGRGRSRAWPARRGRPADDADDHRSRRFQARQRHPGPPCRGPAADRAAVRIRQALGSRSIIARLGGDEFIAYRGDAETAEQVVNDAQTVLAAFRAPFDLLGEHVGVSVSIGAVSTEQHEDDLSILMTKADLALYKAKAQGKAQSQLFHEDMDVEYHYRQRLKAELRQAVAEGALSLAYQPVIDLKTRRVVGCEALARWHHPELGTIPPSVFIPIAEESGLVSDISRWVLMTATAECQNWPDDVRVAVNISAKDLRSGDVAQMVGTALASSGLPPHRLEIEVTETAVIEEREAANLIFRTLAAQGIGIALDDFGTGYSSLSYLQALPFSKLKIDRSFVIDVVNNERALKLLTNVARLGKDIGLTVTVEGVETEEQLALISAHSDVDQIQGY